MTQNKLSDQDIHTILIIDDTPSNLGVVVSMLEDRGYRVSIAQDGEEGIKRAELVQPDLILLDVMMPGIDGFEACARLKTGALTKDIPVIFMTALATTEHKVRGFDAGAVDYITKPLQIDEIMARVGTHLKLNDVQKQLAKQNALLAQHSEELERRVAERTAELAAREREFRTLAENLPDNLARYDTECRIEYLNQRLVALQGRDITELRGKRPVECENGGIFVDYQALLKETIQTGQPREFELVMPGTDGTKSFHHIRFVAERDADGEIIGALAIGRDVTEQKLAERELLLLNLAVDSSAEAVFLANEAGHFVYVNEEACRSLGYSREELLKMGPVDIDPEITPEILQSLFDAIFSDGPSKTPMQSIHRTREGRTFPVEIADSPILLDGERYALTMVRDISERKLAEAKLYEREQALSAVVENSPDTIIRYDRQLRRIYLNPSMEEVFGQPREQLLNTSPSESSPLPEQYLRALRQVLETGEEQHLETPFKDAKGRARWVDLRLAPEFGANGEVMTVLAIGRDITERKLAEEALRTSDERYRLVFENSPISIWEEDFSAVKKYFDELRASGVADIDAYFAQHPEALQRCAGLARIIDVNQAAVDLHEAQNKESLLSGLFDTFTPESFEAFRQELSGLWYGRTRMTVEAVIKTQAGERRNVTVHFSICPGYEKSFSKVLVSIVDITERKQAEEALAVSEREFRTLAENIPDYIIRYDRNARKLYVNTATARLMGVKADEVLKFQPEEMSTSMRAMSLEDYSGRLRQVLSTGEPQEFEMTLQHEELGIQNHYVRLVPERDEQGDIVGALMVAHDITALKNIEKELMEREQRYREIFENAVEGMYLLEVTDDGRFRNIDINPALAASTGIPREKMIGQYIEDTVPEEVGSQIVEKYRRCLAAGSTITESIELDLPAGKRHYISTITPIEYEGRFHRLIGISRDITELKHIENELKQSREQLRGLTARREEVREEERKYIAREVHDELGQILTGLKMNISLLAHQFGKDSPGLSEHLKETASLTDRSLEVARNVASALRPASLDMGIASALEWLAGRFESNTGIACVAHVDNGEYELSENSAIALFRIAQESLTNVARHAGAKQIEIDLSIGPDDYILKVRDNGRGFDMNRRKMDSFGLVGMHERAIMLGGDFVVESQPGKGTLVMVRIPHKRIEGK